MWNVINSPIGHSYSIISLNKEADWDETDNSDWNQDWETSAASETELPLRQ